MKPFTEVAEICRGDAGELTLWVERRWVLPTISEGESLFNDADVARVEMIAELRRDLAIDDEAMPVILGLIDRLYETRRRLRAILLAVADLPEKWRDTVLRRLSEDISPEDRG